MNAMLGVEVPHTTAINQTTIQQMYIDPPTELVKMSPNDASPVSGTAADGTQIWKITHNGVDTHAIHFHLFHVQIVNRVGWDGAVRLPEANELGWKDTVRMSPLEQVIVALRPKNIANLPFKLANSRRLLDPTQTATTNPALFVNFNPSTGGASNVTNVSANYGWEFAWHCHILGHEENDMMRPIAVAPMPETPTNLTASGAGTSVVLNWLDNSMTANWFTIQRSTDATFPAASTTTINLNVQSGVLPVGFVALGVECASQTGCARTYTDTTAPAGVSVYYRIMANDTVGSGNSYLDVPRLPVAAATRFNPNTLTPGFTGFDNTTGNSAWSATSSRLLVPTASVTPASLAFPSTIVSATSAAQPITITNTGNGTLNIASIAITAPFIRAAGGTCTTTTTTLPIGANCTINVSYRPTVAGAATGTVTFTDNSVLNGTANPTQVVTLTGTGIANDPTASVTPASLTYTGTLQATTSAAQFVTLSNTGVAALTISGITTSGAFARAAAPNAGSCGTLLAAPVTPATSTSCTIGVVYTPPTVTPVGNGSSTGVLTITDNSVLNGVANPTQTVALNGTSVPFIANAVVSALTPAFPDTAQFTTSAVSFVTLSNTGAAPLTLSGISLPLPFARAGGSCATVFPAQVASGGGCTVGVTFTPTAVGLASGVLTFSDNSGGVASTQTAALAGTGVAFSGATPPTNVAVQRVSTTAATVSWVDASTNETAFTIQSSTNNGGTWTNLTAVAGSATVTTLGVTSPATISGPQILTATAAGTNGLYAASVTVSNTTNAIYRVVANAAAGNGNSSTVLLNNTAVPLLPPSNVAVSWATGRPTLIWTDADNTNTGYTINSCINTNTNVNCTVGATWNNFTPTLALTGSSATATRSTPLTVGTSYSFRIRASRTGAAGTLNSAYAVINAGNAL
jgi:hypothetical protein